MSADFERTTHRGGARPGSIGWTRLCRRADRIVAYIIDAIIVGVLNLAVGIILADLD